MDKSSFGLGQSASIKPPAFEANPVLVTQPAAPLFPIADPQLARLVSAWDTLTPEKRQEILRAADPYRMPCPPFPDPIDLLRRIQWFGLDDDGWDCCPLCERRSVQGHKDFCDIDVVLRAHGTAK